MKQSACETRHLESLLISATHDMEVLAIQLDDGIEVLVLHCLSHSTVVAVGSCVGKREHPKVSVSS